MLYELEKSGLTPEAAFSRSQEFIGSGATLPVATPIDRTDTLIKLVPQGGAVPHGSPYWITDYWITESEYRQLTEQPGAIADRLGLPLQSRADAYDAYAIRPADSGAVVYQSVTAPTRQGSFVQPGGSVHARFFNTATGSRAQVDNPVHKDGKVWAWMEFED